MKKLNVVFGLAALCGLSYYFGYRDGLKTWPKPFSLDKGVYELGTNINVKHQTNVAYSVVLYDYQTYGVENPITNITIKTNKDIKILKDAINYKEFEKMGIKINIE